MRWIVVAFEWVGETIMALWWLLFDRKTGGG